MKTKNVLALFFTIFLVIVSCTGGYETSEIPDGVSTYIVEENDDVFSIARNFKIEPETILLSNSESLRDNPMNIKAVIMIAKAIINKFSILY